MALQRRFASDVYLVINAFVVGILLQAILGMVLAAVAFASGIDIVLPFVASFAGTRGAGDSAEVQIDGSVSAVLVVGASFAVLCWLIATRVSKTRTVNSAT